MLASSMVVYGEGRYVGPAGETRPAPRRIDDLRAGLFEPRGGDDSILAPALTDEDSMPRGRAASMR